jgi:hypothetical protein
VPTIFHNPLSISASKLYHQCATVFSSPITTRTQIKWEPNKGEKSMASATISTPTLPSYQTVPLEEYSQEFQGLAHRLFQRVSDVIGTHQPKEYKGSYSIFAAKSSATVAKLIIYEGGKGKTNGNWPELRDGVYALVRANDEIGDRIWNELLPARLPAELDRANRDTTIGVAPNHSEQFAYIRVTEQSLEAIARYLAVGALT